MIGNKGFLNFNAVKRQYGVVEYEKENIIIDAFFLAVIGM